MNTKYFIILNLYKISFNVNFLLILDFCRKLSKKEKNHDDDTSFSSDEEFKQPFHHPFLVKERPNIVMNIRVKTILIDY